MDVKRLIMLLKHRDIISYALLDGIENNEPLLEILEALEVNLQAYSTAPARCLQMLLSIHTAYTQNYSGSTLKRFLEVSAGQYLKPAEVRKVIKVLTDAR